MLCGTARQKAGFSLIYAVLSVLVVSLALVLARASQMGFDALMDPDVGSSVYLVIITILEEHMSMVLTEDSIYIIRILNALSLSNQAADNPDAYVYWTARRTLSVLAGGALAANTLKEWCEWRADAENVAAFAHLQGQCARNACCR